MHRPAQFFPAPLSCAKYSRSDLLYLVARSSLKAAVNRLEVAMSTEYSVAVGVAPRSLHSHTQTHTKHVFLSIARHVGLCYCRCLKDVNETVQCVV